MKKGFLNPLALFAFGVVIEQFAIIIGNYQLIVFYFNTIFLEAQTFTIE